ncbi:MAG: 16S rRNA (guanine(527)-N(7))-methyltransferase RsmG [Rhodobacteraceae bacterium]|jgi:16S rRNA (guanine527-N7)-methyltransferase|nr:16S rRNA (guanine(527)-N(7))-methyltransferase RsmG [Paracoccaceae bacterium]
MDRDLWQRLDVSEAALEKLRLFAALVEKWTARINLIARSTVPEIWQRHIEDSARLALYAPPEARLWADFGSGAGFPGLVVAAILQDRDWPTRLILIESDLRKATFLREAVRQTGISAEIRAERSEKLPGLQADVVSARALAALDNLLETMDLHGAPGAKGLFPKGETWGDEVAAARKSWSFTLDAHADPGHKGGIILELGNLHRAGRDRTA